MLSRNRGTLSPEPVRAEDKPAFEEFTIGVLELSTVMKPVNISGSTGVKFTPGSAAPTARLGSEVAMLGDSQRSPGSR